MRILVLHGPNLNRLGRREPEIYGRTTLAELDEQIRALGVSLGVETRHLQSNHEGVLIDAIHAADDDCDGLVFNPGAFTHYSYAIRDAIASIRRPCVEVHLSDIHQREPWRRISVISEVCVDQIVGRGPASYLDGLRLIVERLRALKAQP
jgi:3-dehydroquinate dehydratase-2